MDYYLWIKALHLISVISWMAALFYLPRLFVYHVDIADQKKTSALFKTMEGRLMRIIMTPAMIATWGFGIWMLVLFPEIMTSGGWMHAKLTLVVFMTIFHHVLIWHRKQFLNDKNTKSGRYFRVLNEVPTLLMIAIVVLAIVKPF